VRWLIAAHLGAVLAEWASIVAVLVYAFDRGGVTATGLSSLALLAPVLVGAPLAGVLVGRVAPQRLRVLGLLLQAVGYGAAALAAAAGAPVAVVVIAAVVALIALTTLRPTGAVLLPAVVRSTSELTRGTLHLTWCDGASALVGPLLVAGLLALGGPPAALAGCASVLLAAALVSTVGVHGDPPASRHGDGWTPGSALAGAFSTVRERPWTAGVLGATFGRDVVLGALDVLLVVLALGVLDLGEGGAGLLNALVGLGAAASAFVATVVVRRTRLAPWMAVALTAAAVLLATLGAVTELPVAVVVLPVIGLCAVLVGSLGRMLLQRSADPRLLGSVFALAELVGGVGLLVGSGLAQLLIALADVEIALFGVAGLLLVLVALTSRSLGKADAGADVPVVEMTVLQALPMFAPLPPLELEAVARTCQTVTAADGEEVVRQGEVGERFYAVAEGAFDVVQSGEHIRMAERGSFFGEVALLADVRRTATVTARGPGRLLAVDREPFLTAVTGTDRSHDAAWDVVQGLELEIDIEIPSAERGC